jgi:hypothetical protein
MWHSVRAEGPLPSSHLDNPAAATNICTAVAHAVAQEADMVDLDVTADDTSVYVQFDANETSRSLLARMEDFKTGGSDEFGEWEFAFDTVDVDLSGGDE